MTRLKQVLCVCVRYHVCMCVILCVCVCLSACAHPCMLLCVCVCVYFLCKPLLPHCRLKLFTLKLEPTFPGVVREQASEGLRRGPMGLEACLFCTPGPVLPSEDRINNPSSAFQECWSLGPSQTAGWRLYSPHVVADNFICAPRDLRLV